MGSAENRATRVVAIGGSWGGSRAVRTLLGGLPGDFPAAVAVVLHRSVDSSETALVSFLSACTDLPVSEVEDKAPALSGHVYLAPPDYHLMLEEGEFALSTEGRVQFARPSIDVLFESAAETFGRRAVGVLLTGANADGAAGLARIGQCGGRTLVQDPAEAERPEMPAAAIAAGAAERVLRLDEISPALVELCATTADGGGR